MTTVSKVRYVNYPFEWTELTCSGSTKFATNEKYSLLQTRTGVGDPMFRSKVSKGVSATNAFSASRQFLHYEPGSFTAYFNSVGCPNHGVRRVFPYFGLNAHLWIVNSSVPQALVDSATNDASIAILKAIRDSQRQFSGPTFLGELREAIHMLKRPARALSEYTLSSLKNMKALHKATPKARKSKVLAESWLEFSFGWVPLAADLTDISTAALSRFDARISRVRVRRQSQDSSNVIQTFAADATNVNHRYEQCRVRTASVQFLAGVKVQSTRDLTPLQRVIALGGFDLSEVVPTAWELLPWSFLVDYFSNIGDVLTARFTSTEDVVWWCKTVRGLVKYEYIPISFTPASPFVKVTSWNPARLTTQRATVDRTSAGPAIPQFRFDLPGHSSQFLNIAALARLRF